MRYFVICVVLLIFSEGCRKVSWLQEDGTSEVGGLHIEFLMTDREDYNLRAIHFNDMVNGIACGYNGDIIRTTDGGLNWKRIEAGFEVPLLDIDFVDSNVGFIVGGDASCVGSGCTPPGALMLRTTDGGITWSKVELTLLNSIDLRKVLFVNEAVGFAIGGRSLITTRDGGNTWEERIFENLGGSMFDIDFSDALSGSIICLGGKMLYTTDGGYSWSIDSSLSTIGSVCIAYPENEVLYASGSGQLYKAEGQGGAWIDILDGSRNAYDLQFLSADLGFVFGSGNNSGGEFPITYGAIAYTRDGGETWIENRDILESTGFHDSSFPKMDCGFIVSRGAIAKVELLIKSR